MAVGLSRFRLRLPGLINSGYRADSQSIPNRRRRGRMADNYVHFYGGTAAINRLSWLRTSSKFLTLSLESPRTKWIVFRSGQPLVRVSSSIPIDNNAETKQSARPPKAEGLAYIDTSAVRLLLGPAPYFEQAAQPGEHPSSTTTLSSDHSKAMEASRVHGPPIVFLGVKEPSSETALPSSEFRTPEKSEDIRGEPYFALDISLLPGEEVQAFLNQHSTESGALAFAEPRGAASAFDAFDASVFAAGRSMTDWIVRNKFCTACGARNYHLWGGWKIACSTLLPFAAPNSSMHPASEAPCPSGKGLQNFQHPRTDLVVITAVLDQKDTNRILLGRNKKFPGNFYSTLAGFIEPAESIEEAVRREIWEESGIRVGKVQYHSCQPWPYPVNLMVGCYAVADASQTIRTDLDNELQDARWFTKAEVLKVLAHPDGTNIRKRELANIDKNDKDIPSATPQDSPQTSEDPAFRIPPITAIAGVLISKWANGEVDRIMESLVGEGVGNQGKAKI